MEPDGGNDHAACVTAHTGNHRCAYFWNRGGYGLDSGNRFAGHRRLLPGIGRAGNWPGHSGGTFIPCHQMSDNRFRRDGHDERRDFAETAARFASSLNDAMTADRHSVTLRDALML